MKGVWPTIRSYIFWQHERGTLHYDIMVTLILIFVFLSPRVINFNDKPFSDKAFNDKPALRNPHLSDVVVTADGQGDLVYQISADAVTPGEEQAVRAQLLHIIEPISGEVTIVKYDGVPDLKGQVQSYRVWVKRKP
jgi:hypothetical protein